MGIIKGITFGWFYKTLVSDELFFINIYFIYFSELTKAYSVLSNLNSRREYDKEIGAYFTMRSVKKKEAGEKMLRLTDEMLEIDMNGTREVTVFF